MGTPSEAQDDASARARATYDAAADSYLDPVNSFWDTFGERTIERLDPPVGAHVLDMCCGAGSSALPAARQVGTSGAVLGVDLSEKLLTLARVRAAQARLDNVQFERGDMMAFDHEPESFDVVVCVFGILWAPEPADAVRELLKMVRSGGTLAITAWGPNLFEPANTIFWDEIEALRPELRHTAELFQRSSDPESLTAIMVEGGIMPADVVSEPGSHHIADAEDWWSIVSGSGYRGTIEQLTPDELDRVHDLTIARLDELRIIEVETDVVYATAIKP